MAAGDEQGVALVNCWLTELEARACNLPQASTYAGEAIAILDLGRHDLNLGYALFARALTAAYEGDEHLAVAWSAAVWRSATPSATASSPLRAAASSASSSCRSIARPRRSST